ncbi:ATP-binding protein [Paludisphaera borealis]|uniref:histidine kinase n=1 Tax=Paludisphaera borealis TaxID=1387353 RepID=A0A1U7CX26_9BACT|nr:ATP-binding protein [Paludisphaera borealis]APW63485.1 Alkaline phosphatase synthesis sensor protein PhoR [Paludisphaera borealis]
MAFSVVAAVGRFVLSRWLDDHFILATGFLAAVAASWIGGFGPGLATLILSFLLITRAGVAGVLQIGGQPTRTEVVLYSVAGFGVAWLGGRMRSALAAAEVGRLAARERQERLDEALGERRGIQDEKERLLVEQSLMRAQAERQSATLAKLVHELQEKSAFTEAILRQVPSGIIAAEAASGGLVFRNDVAQRIARDPLEPGRSVTDSVERIEAVGFRPDGVPYHPDDWPLMRCLRTGEVVENEEIELRFPEGVSKTISVNAGPVLDASGRIVAAVTAFDDVTEARRGQDALVESENRFRRLAGAIPHIVWISNFDDSLEFLNNGWFDYTGMSAGATNSQDEWSSAIHPDDLDSVHEARRRALAACASYEVEYRIRGRDGVYRWFLGRGVPVCDEQGSPVSFFGTATDIDDRKRDERSARFLADVGAKLAAVVDEETTLREIAGLAVPFFADWCGVDLIEENHDLRRVAVTYDGSTPEDVVDVISHRYRFRTGAPHGLLGVVQSRQPDLVADVTDDILVAVAQNEEHLQALRAFNPRSYLCVPLIGRDGVLGAMSFATTSSGRRYDPKDLKLAMELAGRAAVAIENVRLYDRLRETDRRKDEFLATLAHELRNPLAPIRNAVLILRLKGSTDTDSQWAREVIERQVGHMSRLIDDLLDVSRITRNKLELRLDRVDLAAAVGDAVETSRPLLDSFGHELKLDLPTEPVVLLADRTRLVQVFASLLNNAAKYTDRGGVIALSVRLREHVVEISVKDSGIGIDPEQLPHVFEMFAQFTPSIDRTQGGLGIGLALVKGLVELHKGIVEARSAGLGAGSEFLVRLPLAASTAARGARTGPGDGSHADRPHSRVLVVDDSEDIAESLGRVLSLKGHEVHLAHDGEKAFALAGSLRPDFAVLDIGLPGMNGYELARAIRKQPWGRAITLIAVTGWGQINDRRRSSEAGFNHHLVKPVEPTTLLQLIGSPSSNS